MPSESPTTAPTSARRGRSGSAGGGGRTTCGGGGPATTGAGARRDGSRIGRSRVALSDFSGIAHSGLPRGSRVARIGFCRLAASGTGSATIGAVPPAPNSEDGGAMPVGRAFVSSVACVAKEEVCAPASPNEASAAATPSPQIARQKVILQPATIHPRYVSCAPPARRMPEQCPIRAANRIMQPAARDVKR